MEKLEMQQLTDQLYCMDCLELMERIPDCTVSLILTDPPYGISYQNQFTKRRHSILPGDEGIPYERFAKESYRILQKDAHAYFFTRFDCYSYHYECLEQAGFQIKNCMVIEKGTIGGIGDLQGSFANNAEWILFCQKGRRMFNHTTLLENKNKEGTYFHKGRKPSKKYKTRFNACWFGSEYPKSTYHSMWQKKMQIFHPTVKNVECLSWLIQISSFPGELVFDGFMGVGSTALAAMKTNRHYLGSEINLQYFQMAEKRIVDARGENGGENISKAEI